MKSIKKFYLVETQYGINMIAETHENEFYQQIHTPTEMSGGGVSTWEHLEKDVDNQPRVINAKTITKSA